MALIIIPIGLKIYLQVEKMILNNFYFEAFTRKSSLFWEIKVNPFLPMTKITPSPNEKSKFRPIDLKISVEVENDTLSSCN